MSDPRSVPVEENLESFCRTIAAEPVFTVGRRAREVVAPYLERGLPFLWWTTPSGHADELRPVLTELGLQELAVPGMYLEPAGPLDPVLSEGIEVRQVAGEEMGESVDVMLAGFEMPEFMREPFHGMTALVGAVEMIQVTAWLNGRAVGCGSAWMTADTVGLYNITTLPSARRRGVGRAVTAALVNAAMERGATRAILHTSEEGFPVYQRLGFETVCQVPQFGWLPPDED